MHQHSHTHTCTLIYNLWPMYTQKERETGHLSPNHHGHPDVLQENKPGSPQSQSWRSSWSPRDSGKGLLFPVPCSPMATPSETYKLRAAQNYKAKIKALGNSRSFYNYKKLLTPPVWLVLWGTYSCSNRQEANSSSHYLFI